ncbi:MAG: hypothetical protein FJ125_12360 [Deltaproteobacteria bacterium]|nr:hypothetical protein [Deltaproteobacteria bacterium]
MALPAGQIANDRVSARPRWPRRAGRLLPLGCGAALAPALLLGAALLCSRAAGAQPRLRLATTTSTVDSGLLEHLLPAFEQERRVQVDVVAVGTGKALALGRAGDVDVLLVHAEQEEQAFVAEGHGTQRLPIMYNDSVVVGPAADPAVVRKVRDGADALQRIAAARATFTSRGDRSGTHVKELSLWKGSGLFGGGPPPPGAGWYLDPRRKAQGVASARLPEGGGLKIDGNNAERCAVPSGMSYPTSPFAPVPMLFLATVDSELQAFLQEAHGLLVRNPALIARAEADLDAHGCGKKALRLADAAWRAERTGLLPGCTSEPAVIEPARLTLAQGRPRTPAYVVLMAVLLRGFFGAGFKSCDATTMMQESITLRVFFANLGLTMPGRSTLAGQRDQQRDAPALAGRPGSAGAEPRLGRLFDDASRQHARRGKLGMADRLPPPGRVGVPRAAHRGLARPAGPAGVRVSHGESASRRHEHARSRDRHVEGHP